jgi:hypothetical protein
MKNWTKNNMPMVFKVNDFADVEAYTQGFSILSDLTTFLDKSIGLSEEEILSYSSQKTKKSGQGNWN